MEQGKNQTPTERKCTSCGCIKQLEAFYKSKNGKHGRHACCKDCMRYKMNKKARNDPKEKKAYRERRKKIRKKYNLDWETYEQMLMECNNRCSICGEFPTAQSLAIDHDHKTGKVRGLLCNLCNSGLGFFKDDSERLIKAIEYLGKVKNPI